MGDGISTTHARHIRLGDHLCLPFATDAEQQAVVDGRLYESEFAETVGGALAAVCRYDERLLARHAAAVRVDPLHDDRKLRIVPSHDPPGLRIAGVVDDTTIGPLTEALRGAEDVRVVLDLTELTFIDVAGIRALVRCAEAVAPRQRIVVRGASPTMRRVLRIAGWTLEMLDDSP